MEGSLLLWCLSPGSEWPGTPGISPSPLSGWGCLPSKNQNCVVLFSWRNLISTWYQPVHLCRRIFSYKKSNYMSFFAMKLPVTFLLEGTSSKNGTSLNIQVSFRLHLGGKSSSGDPRILLRGRGSCCCSSFMVLEMLQLHPWKLTWNPQNWELEPMLFLFQMEHFQCPC